MQGLGPLRLDNQRLRPRGGVQLEVLHPGHRRVRGGQQGTQRLVQVIEITKRLNKIQHIQNLNYVHLTLVLQIAVMNNFGSLE